MIKTRETNRNEPALAVLEKELREQVRGEVHFDEGYRHLYATDSSNYRQLSLGVVLPRDENSLAGAVRVCHRHRTPVTLRGGGTSLAGQTTNRSVIIDHSKYLRNGIEIDAEHRLAHVSPGVVLDDLQRAAAKHGLRFGPDPSTHNNCTIGGMIGNNACGVHSVASSMAGLGARTSDNVARLEIVTADGQRMSLGPTPDESYDAVVGSGGRPAEIYRELRSLRDDVADLVRAEFPDIPRRVSGYNLDELLPENGFHLARALAGTEGTCATVLRATLHLIPRQRHRVLAVLGFADVFVAGDAVTDVLSHRPDALEGMDKALMDLLRRQHKHAEGVSGFPDGEGWLLVEFAEDSLDRAQEKAQALVDAFHQKTEGSTILTSEDEQEAVWDARESGLGVTAHVQGKPDAWEGWEDTAVPPDRLGDYLRELRALIDRYEYEGPFYGHFGQGLVHTRLTFDLRTGPGIAKYRSFVREGAKLVKTFGGSLSGEHGDGQSRGELLGILYSEEMLEAFARFKSIWDPEGLMNPGKVVRPFRLDENLRISADNRPRHPRTHFQYPDDHGDFAYATERCVGVGNCRKTTSGTMCPSFMATREEMHSTRGRAHLLFELLNGRDPASEGWQDETVKASLDLCLACKACKSECPVNVDMATYKAEFMAHYYEHARRPRAAYAMGYIMHWARLASRVPKLANFFTQNPLLRQAAKRIGGLAPARALPRFAPVSFRHWFGRRPERPGDRRVVLWPDTFNNHFHPGTARAAVDVLEHVGGEVQIPDRPLCCGRPFYDFGLLDQAERMLRKVLDTLKPELEQGTPIVVLEPSCLSVFRDESVNLFPDDALAQRLAKQSFSLAEYLQKETPDAPLPQVEKPVAIHTHCHHDAIYASDADASLWERLHLDWQKLDTGCCGMAGSFGFEPEKYKVSCQVAEHRFLPALRALKKEAILIADGFSCRQQAEDLAGIRPRHLAEVIAAASIESF